LRVDLSNNTLEVLRNHSEDWRVTMIDTGLNTLTGGRIKRVEDYVGAERFLLTYGDGVGDIDIPATVKAHEKEGKLLTMTTYQPTGKLGVVDTADDGTVRNFLEKPKESGSWINAGFFVCETEVFSVLGSDNEMFEREPMQRLLEKNQINAYRHTGFWKPMDTLRDNQELNLLWQDGNAPWKLW
jgi:glucose-1-phosphate cytidylyltransferase